MDRRTFIGAVSAAALAIPLLGCEGLNPADTLAERWLEFVRRAGYNPPKGYNWRFLGGDVTDCILTRQGAAMWIGSDWFAGGLPSVRDDKYVSGVLPLRNGCIFAPTANSWSKARQVMTTNSLWLDGQNAPPNGQKLSSREHWWPIAGYVNPANGLTYIAAWRTENTNFDQPPSTPYGTLRDNHLIVLNGFGTYGAHVAHNVASDHFWIDGLVDGGDGFTYIYGEQFVPDYESGQYGIGSPQDDYTLKRVARVSHAQLTQFAEWRYWDGLVWQPDASDAVPMVTPTGAEVQGDAGVQRISSTHWLLAAHRLAGPNMDVYRSALPQGPWVPIAQVPLPGQGAAMHGGTQVGQLVKILPRQVQSPPAGHSLAMVSRNILNVTGSIFSVQGRNIRCYAPQIVAVPHA